MVNKKKQKRKVLIVFIKIIIFQLVSLFYIINKYAIYDI